ncbi:MAG TPA: histidine-type phosphatase, partial [Caulobacteraceae bacterium]|nr:histidine-type phosphatase [Caulobacteraceae bacterium]
LALLAGPAFAAPRLERVVVVMRHGVRPPTQSNAELAKYADRPWPAWSVAPGALTPHGGETVRLMGDTLRAVYRQARLLPAGCAGAGEVAVWADGADERTQKTGEILAEALQPGCGLKAAWSDETPRDPIFGGSQAPECRIDPDKAKASLAAALAGPAGRIETKAAVARLQAILAPDACSGGPGACLTIPPASAGMASVFPQSAGLAEDILLEYADGKPMSEVGWGRASAADIAAIMPIHERAFAVIRDEPDLDAARGAQMVRVILDALAGEPASGGPRSGPDLKLLGLAGHDTNLILMAGVFGLEWTLPDEPDATAPSTALAFELWKDGGKDYVRPVIYYETLEQLRSLKPDRARALPLAFKDCASGPMGSCPVETLRRRAEARLPPDCK